MKKLLLLSLLFVFSISLNAQTWTNYTTTNTPSSLSNITVSAVVIDNDGYKWFGTSEGLMFFDGESFTPYTTADGLVSNNITSLAYDVELNVMWVGTDKGLSQFDLYNYIPTTWLDGIRINALVMENTGKLWFATNEGIYTYYQYSNPGEEWNHYTKETTDGLLSDQITCIAADPTDNNIWFGTYNSGAGKYDGEVFTSYDLTGHYINTGNMALSIAVDYSGQVWFGTPAGVLKYNGEWFSYYSAENGPKDDYINTIIVDQYNTVWVGTNGGISHFTQIPWDNFSTNEGLLCNHVNAIAVDDQGHPWIGAGLSGNSSGVVSTFDGDVWRNYALTDGLLCNYASCISIDSENNKWFGFGYAGFGVAEFDGTTWTNYSMKNGLISNNVNCILTDSQGNKWFGTSNGVSEYDGSSWSSFDVEYSNLLVNIFGIAEDHSGNLWFATLNGVVKYDGDSWTSYTYEDGLPGEAILSITVDANDNILVGSQYGGVSKFDGTLPWTTISADGLKLESNYISTLKTDAQNNLWLGYGTEGFGVTKFNGTDWTHIHKNAGIIDNNVTSIAPDVFDIKWFGTINGISKLQGTKWTSYTTTDGLVGNFVHGIAIDNEGNKWFVTEKGISKLEDLDLSVSQSSLNVTCTNNSTASFDVISNNSWTITSNQTWLTLSNSSGSGLAPVSVTATFNPGETPRSAVVTVSGTGVTSKTVTVTQAATILTVSQTALDIAVSNNSTASFTITSNIGWAITSDKTWLTLSGTSGTNNGSITVTGSANASESVRTAIVTVTGNGISKSITVNQAASVLTLSKTAIDIASTANSSATFDITSNIGWSVASDQTWLTISGLSGFNNASITLTAAINPDNTTRTATITVSGTGVTSKTITITQAATIPTGFKEISDPGILLYPIPVIDKLNISLSEPSSKTSITLYNRSGIVLYTSTSAEGIKELDMSQYASGVYYVKIITSDNKISIRKIIKQ